MDTVAKFSNLPSGLIQQINGILACPGSTVQELSKTVNHLEQVWQSVVLLDGVEYKPKFQV